MANQKDFSKVGRRDPKGHYEGDEPVELKKREPGSMRREPVEIRIR